MPSNEVASGGGRFLLGDDAQIFAPEEFGSDEQLMIKTASDFARREVGPLVERLDHQEDGLMETLFAQAGALGFAGPETPEKYGGLGLSKALGTRMLEHLSLNGSFSTTVAVHMGIGQAPISLWGTSELCSKYLPRLTSGEWMSAYALSEPDSGSDALGMTTRVTRDGDDCIVDGTKMWISNAKWAKTFVTFAKRDDGRIDAFVVERGFPGVSIGPEEHKAGLKGSSTARLILDSVRVPKENLIYHEGEGHRVAFNALNLGRLKLGSMSLGPSRSALHHAARYAKERKQFGCAIAEFGLIRQKLANCAALFYAAESVLYRTAHLVDGAFSRSAGDADSNRIAAEVHAVECSINKIFSTEVLALCADEALQIHGGYGFTEEFPVARIWRDARVTRIYEGTNEINRLFIFERLLKQGVVDQLATVEPVSFIHGLVRDAFAAARHAERSQQVSAALSDLAVLYFAESSAMARAKKTDAAFNKAASSVAISILHARAATAAADVFGRLGVDRHVALPSANYSDSDALAEMVLDATGYPA
ncbi:MAG: acyl-CoA dehydrogenase family protein [Armatimonadota bacterium]|nr:acyl-CoA dehydrogenase family protein [Armatimonadota bacterium]